MVSPGASVTGIAWPLKSFGSASGCATWALAAAVKLDAIALQARGVDGLMAPPIGPRGVFTPEPSGRLRSAHQRRPWPAAFKPKIGETPGRALLGDDRLGLDLDAHVAVDQPVHLDHRARGADVAEHLAVGSAHFLPPLEDVGDVDAGPHHVLERGPGLLQGRGDPAQDLPRLLRGIAREHHRPVGRGGGGAGDVADAPDPHRPRVADDGFPLGTGRDELTHGAELYVATHQ